ncbi:hypothetical protein A7X72_01467 [Lactococcus garvieae]|jgi:hypothetical protein|nr:hypothetical protein [Lactococcus petauri]MDC7843826.1 hypothetical protein [Lactococcus petauri]MDC7845772.1 hypothetical protein [Lactococcus petauri]OAL08390.1 hypothetical protein A7X72_01467 [Lactococcus garvieae]UQU60711.1 hypothetical protein lgb_01476 [Lactococcus petauri]
MRKQNKQKLKLNVAFTGFLVAMLVFFFLSI